MFGNIRVRSNHKSVERKFESSARNTLPIEIWLEIARYVEQDTKALRRLAQTDRITHNACIPLLYKTVFLYLQGIRETLQEFPPDRYLSYVKDFTLNTYRESKSLRLRFFLFLVESRVRKMIHLEHVTLVYVQRVPPYLLRHIASLDTLRSVTINSCTLPQAPLRLRASLESLTLTLVEGNIVNFYKACRNSLKTLSLSGPLCTVLTKALYANPPPHLTKLEIRQTRYLNVEALRSGIINECPTIIHLAISWLDRPLIVPANTLPRLEILEIPLHCVSDIVPGRPVHTYDQTGGIMWNDTITPALQALRHSTSHITVLRLWVGNLDASLVILNGIEPLVSALRVLQLDSCEFYYVCRSFSKNLRAADWSMTEFCPPTCSNTPASVHPANLGY